MLHFWQNFLGGLRPPNPPNVANFHLRIHTEFSKPRDTFQNAENEGSFFMSKPRNGPNRGMFISVCLTKVFHVHLINAKVRHCLSIFSKDWWNYDRVIILIIVFQPASGYIFGYFLWWKQISNDNHKLDRKIVFLKDFYDHTLIP